MKAKIIPFIAILMIIGCSTLNRNYRPAPIIEYVPLPYIEHDTVRIPPKPLSEAEKQVILRKFYDNLLSPRFDKLEGVVIKQEHTISLQTESINRLTETNINIRNRSIKSRDSLNKQIQADTKENVFLKKSVISGNTQHNIELAKNLQATKDYEGELKRQNVLFGWIGGIFSLGFLLAILLIKNERNRRT